MFLIFCMRSKISSLDILGNNSFRSKSPIFWENISKCPLNSPSAFKEFELIGVLDVVK